MLLVSTSLSFFFLAHLVPSLAASQVELCASPASRSEEVSDTCRPTQSRRGLLQTASERARHPSFDTAEEAIPIAKLAEVAASAPVSAGTGRVQPIRRGLLNFGKGIESAEEHIATRSERGDFEELVEPRLAGAEDKQSPGYALAASVGDVSSVFTLFHQSDISKDSKRRLAMVDDKVEQVRNVGLISSLFVIIIIACVFLLLLAGFAGNRSSAEDGEAPYSSDSEKFGSPPKYKSRRMSPQMPGRYGRGTRNEPPQDQFSPAPRQRVAEQPPPPSQSRFSPIPPPRGSSPYAPQAQPYQMQPPPSNTQMPPEPMPVPDTAISAGPKAGSTSSVASSKHLCPGLVVPKGNECVLAVPTLKALNVPPRNTAAFFVRDLGGKPVIQAEILVQPWNSLGAGVGQRPIAVLRTAISQGDEPAAISDLSPLLAYVKASFEAGGRRSAYVYDARDEIFAHVAKDPFRSCYVLTSSRMGVQVIFTGNFPQHQVEISNEARDSLAEVDPCTVDFDSTGEYYKIRVVSHVDVGLMLCGLLAIEHMEAA